MKVIDFLKVGREFLKLMSNCDIKCNDYVHIELYEDYMEMRKERHKVDYILAILSDKYKMSESTIKRIIRRFSKEVK